MAATRAFAHARGKPIPIEMPDLPFQICSDRMSFASPDGPHEVLQEFKNRPKKNGAFVKLNSLD